MSRRYRKSHSSRRGKGPDPIALLILCAAIFLRQYWKVVLAVIVLATVGFLTWRYISRRKTAGACSVEVEVESVKAEPSTYSSKTSIMSDCERSFFEAIKELVEPQYIVQPQVNLASVIDKTSQGRYRNELFRNIDFGIFDKSYKLLVLIEINDQTHMTRERKERDQKVKSICDEANIPLVTLWAQYGVNKTYIQKRLSDYLSWHNTD